ncbi:MAG: AMP-binding protein [Burkholderiaceae bacterium]|jgi:phenylacetate-CoA ligase|nr:AMP-binding protein [Burkholderiaceae bacterium]MDH5207758.1 AMP-binding protein [Burkholderiaceae bacterium]
MSDLNPSITELPFLAGLDAALWAEAAWQVWQGSRLGAAELAECRRRRLLDLLRHARSASPFYRDLHAGLPNYGRVCLADCPAVDKRTLMREFDRVSTRPEVNLRTVERFVSDPARLGSLLHGRYAVWSSSGTTGHPGLFVHDSRALAVYDALETQRFRGQAAGVDQMVSWMRGERYALVAATGGHFAGVSSVQRLLRALPWMTPFVRACSLLQPIDRLVAELNAYGPAILATYPTAAEMLAEEQASGRLRLRLRELWTGGECMAPATRARLQSVFGCRVRNAYGASEFLAIAWECPHRQLHVNSDWVILEPVDARGRPVAPGERSHSVLLTNLVNRVQPLIRYDLGDAVTMRSGRCPCGSAFPVIAVEGRCDDVLVMPLARGGVGAVVPLALETVLEERAHVHDFQVVQTALRAVTVRLGGEQPASAASAVRRALHAYFQAMGFADIALDVGDQPPRRDCLSGKLRRVVREVERASP